MLSRVATVFGLEVSQSPAQQLEHLVETKNSVKPLFAEVHGEPICPVCKVLHSHHPGLYVAILQEEKAIAANLCLLLLF